jgi:carboxypeptidase family protein
MKRRFKVFIVVVASACNPTQPSTPTFVPPAIPYVTRHFSGVVLTEDGRPVPAATVSFPVSNTGTNYEANVTTDGNGFYQLALHQPSPWSGTHARVSQILYDDTEVDVAFGPGQTDVTKNFRLYRSMTLPAGESAHLAITPDNSLCWNPDDDLGEYLCRKVHVTVPSSGTLVLDTIADDPSNTFWLSIDLVQSPFQYVTHLSRSVDTATTVVVLVLRPWNITVAGSFTLRTAFAP